MKKALLTLGLFVSLLFSSKAQFVTIPDANFVAWLGARGYAQCLNGNQLDTTCTAVIRATTIDCSYSSIANLTGITYFDSLRNLSCDHNLLTFLPPMPKRLYFLACGNNQLTTLPPISHTMLYQLNCYHNPGLGSLPAFPSSLRILYCNNDSLKTFPSFPATMSDVNCEFNHLDTLPPLPATMRAVRCGYNNITVLPTLNNGLYTLDCAKNSLTVIPQLPASLASLRCTYNSLTSLPALPSNLISLECGYNPITVIPALPDSLIFLNMSNNPLVALPALPDSLLTLDCQATNTTVLPVLPARLTSLYCGSNALGSLPTLPNTLHHLNCRYAQLTSLPEFPDSLNQCDISYNPQLKCLPRLKKIDYFDFGGTGITCLPNYGQINSSTPALSTLPLCAPGNTNNCNVYWNISGQAYHDANTNCLVNAGDTAQQNIKVMLKRAGILVQQQYTGGEGLYSFSDDSVGVYKVSLDAANTPFRISCPASQSYIDTISHTDSLEYNNDFALNCKPGFDIGANSIYAALFRPANFTRVNLQAGDLSAFYHAHCAAGVSGKVTLNIFGPAKYISSHPSALTPSSFTNTQVEWTVQDFGAIDFFSAFNIQLQTDTTAQIGERICMALMVTPFTGDYQPGNNSLEHCFTVVGSFDPNIKEVSPPGDIDTAQKWLTYTIHFQNTGTAEAQNIHVDDTLNANLDVETFQLLAYSHQPQVQLKGNAVRFNFANINLPDSNANEPASHGYIQYKIRLKDNLQVGAQIKNTAFIYFDFNSAVVTNTTTNTITLDGSTGISISDQGDFRFQLYPNPASSTFTIAIPENLKAATVTVTDLTGHKIVTAPLQINNTTLTTDFANGIYFITVTNNGLSYTRKLIVNH